MAIINELYSSVLNGMNINLYELDIKNEDNFSIIKEYLINKINKSVVYSQDSYNLSFYQSPLINKDYEKKLNDKIREITTPKDSLIPAFDVKRERVTEWLAQYILEEKHSCTFYDECDKKINLKPINVDRHTPGIDVPGVIIHDGELKFVVCEVKASEEAKIPSSSMELLNNDIQKAIDNKDNRLFKEILSYSQGLKTLSNNMIQIEKIINFLTDLIISSNNDKMLENIIFFPFIIRKNERIREEKNISDYKNFRINGVSPNNFENIICLLDTSIEEFSKNIYKEALKYE